MTSSKFELFKISTITLTLFFLTGNLYAYFRIQNLKSNAYRSHDKYTELTSYKKNVDSTEINFYGDLCAINGTTSSCTFSDGERVHRFKTDKLGFKTLGDVDNASIIFIGDSFLAASGGDDMKDQFGSVISTLTSAKVYEAAHPGTIDDYNARHSLIKRINPDAKFIYLLYEGNDFPRKSPTLKIKTRPWHYFRDFYVPILAKIPLYNLLRTKISASRVLDKAGRNESQVLVKKLDSGITQAFYKENIAMTNSDLWINPQEYSYIRKNSDSICGIVFIPTADAVYLSKDSLQERHPTLSSQLSELHNLGIDIVDLTSPLREAARKEDKRNRIWWSDDTHWNANGIRVGANASSKAIRCLRS